MSALADAPGYALVPTVVAQYQLNPFEAFVATLSERQGGKRVASLSRIKRTASGELRRMSVFEFGEHRAQAIASLIDELLRAIAKRERTTG